jgi:hypothetical protein
MFSRPDRFTKGRLYSYYDEARSIGLHYLIGLWHFVSRNWLTHAIHSQCIKSFRFWVFDSEFYHSFFLALRVTRIFSDCV